MREHASISSCDANKVQCILSSCSKLDMLVVVGSVISAKQLCSTQQCSDTRTICAPPQCYESHHTGMIPCHFSGKLPYVASPAGWLYPDYYYVLTCHCQQICSRLSFHTGSLSKPLLHNSTLLIILTFFFFAHAVYGLTLNSKCKTAIPRWKDCCSAFIFITTCKLL